MWKGNYVLCQVHLMPNVLFQNHFNVGSISPMIYEQLLRGKIPKVQKDIDDLTVFLQFLDLRI
jgi:hypothetical protein